jgi:tRNA threonylcarbamoyladenosine biosynthesis protein TsaB
LRILGIDTATEILNLAIINNEKLVVDYKVYKEGKTHSAIILPTLNCILNLTEIKLKNIDGIAVSIGPGSFTGLRIGLATAKGLAFSLSIPIVGINNLDCYALNWRVLPGILCPMIKARGEEYYFALYRNNENSGNLDIIKTYQCQKWMKIKEKLLKIKETVYIFGYGLEDIIKNEKINHTNGIDNIYFVGEDKNYSNALTVALMGEKKILEKNFDDISNLLPFYISKSAAEKP